MTKRCKSGKEEIMFWGGSVVRGPIYRKERGMAEGDGSERLRTTQRGVLVQPPHARVCVLAAAFCRLFPTTSGRPANPCPGRSDYKPQPLFSLPFPVLFTQLFFLSLSPC